MSKVRIWQNIRKYQTEVTSQKNTITELKISSEMVNSSRGKDEGWGNGTHPKEEQKEKEYS